MLDGNVLLRQKRDEVPEGTLSCPDRNLAVFHHYRHYEGLRLLPSVYDSKLIQQTLFKSKCYKLLDKFHINKTCGYIYGLWLSLNLTLWLFRDSCYETNDLDCFYPEYGLDDISIYDIREFIFYVFLLPFVFWLVYKLHKCYKMKNHK